MSNPTQDKPADDKHNAADLGKRTVRGVAWLGGGQAARMGVGFLTALLLSRLLSPEDFGLFSMTYLVVELAQLFTNFGLGTTIVQRQLVEPRVLSSCFWANLGIGVLVALAMLVSGPLIAIYFKTENLRALLWPLGLNMLVCSAMVVPQALLSQRLNFRQIAMSQFVGSFCAAIAAATAALSGAGVWTLAIQPLVGNLVTGSLMLRWSNWRPTRHFSMDDIKPLFGFSLNMLGSSMVDFLGRNTPSLIIGRTLGAAALGYFHLATAITGVIVFQITSIIIRVLFPMLSAIKAQPELLRGAWGKASSAISIASIPLMAGAIATAPDLIPIVFGAQWVPAIQTFQILCLLMAVQSVTMPSGSMLLALGRADLNFRLAVGSAIGYAVALMIGSRFSLEACAAGYTVIGITTALAATWMAAREARVPLGYLCTALAPWLLAATLTGFAMYVLRGQLLHWGQVARLMACLALGVLVYLGLLMLVARRQTLVLVNDVIGALRPR